MTTEASQLTITPEGRLTRAKLQGRVCIADLPALKATLARAMAADVGAGVIVDLSGVPLIDSSVLGFLISSYKLLRGQRREMVLTGVPGPCLETLRVTNLTRIMPVFESHDEALRALGG